MEKEDMIMAYKPKIITGRVSGTGWPIDGHTLYFSQWDYDPERWHLYDWPMAADEAVRETIYQSTVKEGMSGLNHDEFVKEWSAGTWEPDGVFCIEKSNLTDIEYVEKVTTDGHFESRHYADTERIGCRPLSAIIAMACIAIWAALIVLRGLHIITFTWPIVLSSIMLLPVFAFLAAYAIDCAATAIVKFLERPKYSRAIRKTREIKNTKKPTAEESREINHAGQ